MSSIAAGNESQEVEYHYGNDDASIYSTPSMRHPLGRYGHNSTLSTDYDAARPDSWEAGYTESSYPSYAPNHNAESRGEAKDISASKVNFLTSVPTVVISPAMEPPAPALEPIRGGKVPIAARPTQFNFSRPGRPPTLPPADQKRQVLERNASRNPPQPLPAPSIPLPPQPGAEPHISPRPSTVPIAPLSRSPDTKLPPGCSPLDNNQATRFSPRTNLENDLPTPLSNQVSPSLQHQAHGTDFSLKTSPSHQQFSQSLADEIRGRAPSNSGTTGLPASATTPSAANFSHFSGTSNDPRSNMSSNNTSIYSTPPSSEPSPSAGQQYFVRQTGHFPLDIPQDGMPPGRDSSIKSVKSQKNKLKKTRRPSSGYESDENTSEDRRSMKKRDKEIKHVEARSTSPLQYQDQQLANSEPVGTSLNLGLYKSQDACDPGLAMLPNPYASASFDYSPSIGTSALVNPPSPWISRTVNIPPSYPLSSSTRTLEVQSLSEPVSPEDLNVGSTRNIHSDILPSTNPNLIKFPSNHLQASESIIQEDLHQIQHPSPGASFLPIGPDAQGLMLYSRHQVDSLSHGDPPTPNPYDTGPITKNLTININRSSHHENTIYRSSSPEAPQRTSPSVLSPGASRTTIELSRGPPPRAVSPAGSVYSQYSFYQLDSNSPSPTNSIARFSPDPSRMRQGRSDGVRPPLLSPTYTPPLRAPTGSRSPSPASTISPSSASFPRTAQDYLQLGIQHHEANRLNDSAVCFEKSAKEDGGCGVGMVMWGLTLRHGWGCEKDERLAFKWLQKAAESAVTDLESSRKGLNANAVQVC